MSRRSGRSPTVVTELARRIRHVARHEAQNAGTAVERWSVKQAKPLIIEEIEGDLTLEEGDPDFTVGDALRQHIASYGLSPGDQVLVAHAGQEWHAFDAASNTTPVKPPAASPKLTPASYTIAGDTPLRTLDPTTATPEQTANVLATVIRDLGGA
jgi:hypothetical protein